MGQNSVSLHGAEQQYFTPILQTHSLSLSLSPSPSSHFLSHTHIPPSSKPKHRRTNSLKHSPLPTKLYLELHPKLNLKYETWSQSFLSISIPFAFSISVGFYICLSLSLSVLPVLAALWFSVVWGQFLQTKCPRLSVCPTCAGIALVLHSLGSVSSDAMSVAVPEPNDSKIGFFT